MKLHTLITTTAATATVFAGEPAPVSAPASSATLGSWFVGSSFGQFDPDSAVSSYSNQPDVTDVQDFEFDMFTLHVGRDLDMQFLGCDLAAYFEIGYLDGNANAAGVDSMMVPLFVNFDLEIIPLTINFKAERTLFAGIKGFATAGIGYAFGELKVNFNGSSDSEDIDGFYAQASLGLAYDFNENWEIYGAARWLYLGDIDLFDSSNLDLDDGIAYEIGVRYHF